MTQTNFDELIAPTIPSHRLSLDSLSRVVASASRVPRRTLLMSPTATAKQTGVEAASEYSQVLLAVRTPRKSEMWACKYSPLNGVDVTSRKRQS